MGRTQSTANKRQKAMIIHFYEKPGCINNARQKSMLESNGHTVIAHSILSEQWNFENLRVYFGSLPVNQWFNMAAPEVKTGAVNPYDFTETAALEAMMADHLLIRRPLIEVNGEYICGFDNELVNQLFNNKDVSHLLTCPSLSNNKSCD
jgi:nitrogenase-associated protein